MRQLVKILCHHMTGNEDKLMTPNSPGALITKAGREAIECSTIYDISAKDAPPHHGSFAAIMTKSSSGLVFGLLAI
jgi:hypothetical protein